MARTVVGAVVCTFTFGAALAGPQTQLIGVRALDGGLSIEPTAINSAGTIVTGHSDSSSGRHAFLWTAAGGLQDLGLMPDFTQTFAYGLSDDGTFVAGIGGFTGQDRAFGWTAATGAQALIPAWQNVLSTVNGVSASGACAGGFELAPGGHLRAYRWSPQTGVQNLGVTAPTEQVSSLAYAISRDGQTVIGVSGTGEPGIGPQTSTNFRWTSATGMVPIPHYPGANGTISTAVSNSGVISGYAYVNFQSLPIRWVSGATSSVSALPMLPGASSAQPMCISDDGSTIGGYTSTEQGNVATLWTDSSGAIDLNAYLASRGVVMTQWKLEGVRALNADASVVAGYGTFRGFPRMFVVTGLNLPCTSADVAGAGQLIGPDGSLTADDIIVFIGWFFTSDPRADIAGAGQSIGADGQFTADDIILFVNRFFAGC
jgi:probable HAF family extracellular repeat protein